MSTSPTPTTTDRTIDATPNRWTHRRPVRAGAAVLVLAAVTAGGVSIASATDGSPQFPDKVIGEWSCRGYFIGDGAHTTEGSWVFTTQLSRSETRQTTAPRRSSSRSPARSAMSTRPTLSRRRPSPAANVTPAVPAARSPCVDVPSQISLREGFQVR